MHFSALPPPRVFQVASLVLGQKYCVRFLRWVLHVLSIFRLNKTNTNRQNGRGRKKQNSNAARDVPWLTRLRAQPIVGFCTESDATTRRQAQATQLKSNKNFYICNPDVRLTSRKITLSGNWRHGDSNDQSVISLTGSFAAAVSIMIRLAGWSNYRKAKAFSRQGREEIQTFTCDWKLVLINRYHKERTSSLNHAADDGNKATPADVTLPQPQEGCTGFKHQMHKK